MQPDSFTAQLLRASLDGFAGLAASLLCEGQPGGAEAMGGFELWKDHQRELLRHLAVALEEGAPEEFAQHMSWSRTNWLARVGTDTVDDSDSLPRAGLESLGQVLQKNLPSHAWANVQACLDAGAQALQQSDPPSSAAGSANELAETYLRALRAGTLEEAEALLQDSLDRGEHDLVVLLDEVISPALSRVGELWQRGEIDVAEEHILTQAARSTLARLESRGERASQRGCTVVLASVAGNAHDLGVRAVASLFEGAGWRVHCTGANTPAEDVALLCERVDADLLALSAALAPQRPMVGATIARVREMRPEQRVLVGGPAFAGERDTWSALGADACATSGRQALELAAKLCQLAD